MRNAGGLRGGRDTTVTKDRDIRPLVGEPLAAAGGIRHGFFTRRGGVSRGVYASLNCGLGSGDRPADVAVNRRRALAALGLEAAGLATGYQTHSTRVAVVDGGWDETARPEADGLVTRRRGAAIGVLTADCAPVLLADAEAGVVGAAHAGWRGALAGILEATVEAMESLGARRGSIAAAIGPCIGAESYEVGPEFPAPFLDRDAAAARFFRPAARSGRRLFDLAGYVAFRLAALGLGEIGALERDTFRDDGDFFSYRRAAARGEADYGRLLSAIALDP